MMRSNAEIMWKIAEDARKKDDPSEISQKHPSLPLLQNKQEEPVSAAEQETKPAATTAEKIQSEIDRLLGEKEAAENQRKNIGKQIADCKKTLRACLERLEPKKKQ